MFDVEQISKKVEEAIEGSPGGCYAIFVPLSEKWAIKLYRDEDTRDETLEIQQECCEIGYGPETGGKFDLPSDEEDDCSPRYGYLTEIIEPLADLRSSRNPGRRIEGHSAWVWAYENKPIIEPIIEFIKEKTGWYFDDHHGFNWGRKNGKLMPLDFGRN
jgi:hypothetical protein